MAIEALTLSSKGQLALPKAMRGEIESKEGTKFMAYWSGRAIIPKPLKLPDANELLAGAKKARAIAKKEGLTMEDAERAIKEARAERKKKQ